MVVGVKFDFGPYLNGVARQYDEAALDYRISEAAKNRSNGFFSKLTDSKMFKFARNAIAGYAAAFLADTTYAGDLKLTLKTKENEPVKIGRVYLINPTGTVKDSALTDANGKVIFKDVTTGITDDKILEETFRVMQNYPNPFNPSTRAEISVGKDMRMDCGVYNVLGQLVKSFDINNGPGKYVVDWHGDDNSDNHVAAGVYFLRAVADNQKGSQNNVQSIKMVLTGHGSGQSRVYKQSNSAPLAKMSLKKDVQAAERYNLRFANTAQTDPRIIPQATDIQISGDVDTTMYVDKLKQMIISGKLTDAYTGGVFAGVPISIINTKTGAKVIGITDANGLYNAAVPVTKTDTLKLDVNIKNAVVGKDTLYNYLQKLNIPWTQAEASLTNDVWDFARFYETGPMVTQDVYGNPVHADSLRDGSMWMKYMQYIGEINPANGKVINNTRRWCDENLPLRYFFDSVPTLDSTYVEDGLGYWNNNLKFKPFKKSGSAPVNGLRIVPGSATVLGGFHFFIDNQGNYLYPIGLWNFAAGNGNAGIARHELWHLLTTTATHSMFKNHLSF
ncbi:MAG: T9SS type A sorting domain-containing protein, partial [Candidatus Aenigmarchaeota archaeon]|nr:T9SS type A sorting domain-containing protein [Candidatus Aenigmarchaeota archaeon]